MQTLIDINGFINGIVWGPWMLTLLVGSGIWLSIYLGFPQIRYFVAAFKEVLGKIGKKSSSEGSISSFAAMATALAATVGTGNIAGVATALHLGGPGALVWMLFSAFFGMTTKFCEVALAVRYREKDEMGLYRGGTMYILEKALNMKWLAVLFAIFTVLAATLGIGNMTQANSTAEGMYMAFQIPHIYTAVVLAVLTWLVVWGGLTRIATVTTYLVPFMAVFYIIGALVVVFNNLSSLPYAIQVAIQGAFGDPQAIPGALAGWAVKAGITRGIARGVFSNEAGLGSAPMAHSAAQVDHPVRQGFYGIFEVFVDTIIICTLTATSILVSGVVSNGLTGAQLTLSAFQTSLGVPGTVVLSVGLALFAFSTILGWYWYGETAFVYLFGSNVTMLKCYKTVYTICIVLGGWGGAAALAHIWDFADTLNGLMAAPNLIGLVLLSKELKRLTVDFDTKIKTGELLK